MICISSTRKTTCTFISRSLISRVPSSDHKYWTVLYLDEADVSLRFRDLPHTSYYLVALEGSQVLGMKPTDLAERAPRKISAASRNSAG